MSASADKPYRASGDGVFLAVKVTPKASRNEVLGIGYHGETPVLRVRVCAAPDKGQANKALLKLIGKWLRIPVSSIRLSSGEKSRLKRIFLKGDIEDQIARLENAMTGDNRK